MSELKLSIAKCIASHCVSKDEKLIYKQAEAIEEFLMTQMKNYERLKKEEIITPRVEMEDGEVVFREGTLIHCASQCDYNKLSRIKEKGIMAGDFIGIPEMNNGESYFCADFYRTDKPMQGKKFIERIKESDSICGRSPFGEGFRNNTKIAFIFDSTDLLRKLTDTDMYKKENQNHPMQLALNLLEDYKEEKRGQVAAIPYGIPSNFISGIIAGDALLQNKNYVEMLQQIFPNCYILNKEGRVFFSPELTLEQNDQNKMECLKGMVEQKEWRKEEAKKVTEALAKDFLKAKISSKDKETEEMITPRNISESTIKAEITIQEIKGVIKEIEKQTRDIQREQQK